MSAETQSGLVRIFVLYKDFELLHFTTYGEQIANDVFRCKHEMNLKGKTHLRNTFFFAFLAIISSSYFYLSMQPFNTLMIALQFSVHLCRE